MWGESQSLASMKTGVWPDSGVYCSHIPGWVFAGWVGGGKKSGSVLFPQHGASKCSNNCSSPPVHTSPAIFRYLWYTDRTTWLWFLVQQKVLGLSVPSWDLLNAGAWLILVNFQYLGWIVIKTTVRQLWDVLLYYSPENATRCFLTQCWPCRCQSCHQHKGSPTQCHSLSTFIHINQNWVWQSRNHGVASGEREREREGEREKWVHCMS